jgi:RHS repeat-associated protein
VRTWNYSGPFLTQTVMPETGTTNFYYNANGTLSHKIDAKNQKVAYVYDSLGRVTHIHFYSVSSNPSPDAYGTTTITYGSTPNSDNQVGRVATVTYYVGTRLVTETYKYEQPGQVKFKRFQVGSVPLDASWTFDNEGRMTSVVYPNAGPTYNFTYNSMGRPSGMTQSGGGTLVSNITYGPAGELLTMSYLGYNETRQYNARLQLTRLSTNNGVSTFTDFEYRFSATQNNGQLWQMKDWVTGEEVTYAYDALQRLSSAVTTGPEWGQSYGYDGFGNLLSQTVTKGAAPMMGVIVDPLTNRVVGTSYDANGNDLTFGTYDVANRLKQSGAFTYGYDPGNKRVWKNPGTGPANEEFYFWAGSQRLGTYKSTNPGVAAFTTASTNVYFGGRLIQAAGTAVLIDRLGSNVTGGKRYFPYGQEKVATANNLEKFTGYFRDAETGLDYADQRYHNPGMGRFTTRDPIGDGLNWYSYVDGDPINWIDPTGESPLSDRRPSRGLLSGLVLPPPADPPPATPPKPGVELGRKDVPILVVTDSMPAEGPLVPDPVGSAAGMLTGNEHITRLLLLRSPQSRGPTVSTPDADEDVQEPLTSVPKGFCIGLRRGNNFVAAVFVTSVVAVIASGGLLGEVGVPLAIASLQSYAIGRGMYIWWCGG